ncbi:MAG: energy-coupled thiamine transporter ThiT [Clostridiales Family XIII bacterium]|jgi:thiamine transporter|nr:energy-coupled thiamine transporter ThiT [Clostridiales Family XIII bacterium]
MNNMNKKLQVMIEGAITAGLAFALSFIPVEFGAGAAFDLSLGMIPLGVYAIRRGLPPALVAGFVWALIKVVTGKMIFLTPTQWVFDYILAFTCAGFLGVFSARTLAAIRSKDPVSLLSWISASAVVGVFARWLWHFIAGFLVWGEYAPEGQSPVVYSLIFNGASFIGNIIMLICVLTLLARWAPVVYLFGLPRESQNSAG